jgi:uncharacterized Fe-S cluster-containing radical SAM superfamily protein
MMRFLSPEAALKLMDLAGQPYRPPEIVALIDEINGKTRVLELRASVGEPISEDDIREVVEIKLKLDRMYGFWAERESGISRTD